MFPSARVPEDVQADCGCGSADRALAWHAKDLGSFYLGTCKPHMEARGTEVQGHFLIVSGF